MASFTPYSSEKIAELRELVAPCSTWLEARAVLQQRLGTHPDNITRLNRRYKVWRGGGAERDEKWPDVSTGTPCSSAPPDTFDSSVELSKAATLEEVMDMCQIDGELWESKGFSVRRGAKGFAWNARFAKRKEDDDISSIVERFKTFADEMVCHAPASFKILPLAKAQGRVLEIAVMDAHFARLCWSKETRGPDYDLKIAVKDYKDAVYALAAHAKVNGASRILLPLGNDHFNSDNLLGTTTKGTAQAPNEDGRWQKAFTTGCEVITEVIETLANEFEVDALVVSGNHDYEKCYYMGEFVRAYFHHHPRVHVDNAPTQRKYYTFGTNLIMFTHGDEERHAALPLIMASEMKDAWAQTSCREIHVGHYHQHRSMEVNGVRLRVISSLAPSDSWSTSKGYVGNLRAAEAFLFDKEDGLVAQYYHTVRASQ